MHRRGGMLEWSLVEVVKPSGIGADHCDQWDCQRAHIYTLTPLLHQSVRIAQAQALANASPGSVAAEAAAPADAQAVAASLVSAFAAAPASDRAALKAEADYVLAALGSGSGSFGAAPAANTTPAASNGQVNTEKR